MNRPTPRPPARRWFFRFGFITCVLPVCEAFLTAILERFSLTAGRPIGPIGYLMKTELAPLIWAMMIVGCFSLILWAWLVARSFAQDAEQNGGKLAPTARWIAGVCSVAAIGGAIWVWWQAGDRFRWEEWKFFGGYALGGGILGLIACVGGGRNPKAPRFD
ncbi:hypothetical protein [Tuwongella immobilis]|uniref:Uncharacterized protein n=1 Tax=Tuwongella immobilis TaxID=692036 RepID=A0A6C2YUZ6_9BACT|nr:hypothetical protein [Tuwongella immobilis]VIP05187.1 unnamed protein product [Tuwongella immobilis]VTS07730.1 unnamed protein product [Tuwongella immobilis]